MLTVATLVLLLNHCTPGVVEVSVNELPRYAVCELFEILTRFPFLTFTLQVPDFEPDFAVIVAEPAALALTIPLASTVATFVFELDHVTLETS